MYITKAEKEDFLQMLSIQINAIVSIPDTYYSKNEKEDWITYLKEKQLQRFNSFISFIYHENGTTAAFVSCSEENNFTKIECLYVLPEFQNKGIGKQLLSYAERSLQNSNARVRTTLNAESFYLKNDYKIMGKEFSRAGFEILVLEKKF